MSAGGVERAVRSELRRKEISVQSDPGAAVAVALARSVDDPLQSASGKAAAVKELRVILASLFMLAAEPAKGDVVDDLASRRATRRQAANQ